MRKIFLIFFIFISSLMADDSILQSIIKNEIVPNIEKAINGVQNVQKNQTKDSFENLVISWKKVETSYVIGELNSDFLDTPRFIDVFNNLKEDLNSQMKRVLSLNNKEEEALFKNSFKTINALEYVMFTDDKNIDENRRKKIIFLISDSILKHLKDIKEAYENYLKNPTKTVLEENAILINSLIASSYRLKEWRVGNAGGFSSKYKNDPKNSRAEYFLSQNSFLAINSILEAQKEILEAKKYKTLFTLAEEKNVTSDIKTVLDKINIAQNDLKTLKKDDFSNSQKVFEAVSQIHDLYYTSIIEKLGLKPDILDADGD